jgi:hypothetical protein
MIFKFINLDSKRKIIVLRCIKFVFLSRFLVSFFNLKALKRVIKLFSSSKTKRMRELFGPEEIFIIHNRIFKFFGNSTCLKKCFSAKLLMMSYGYAPDIVFGIKKNSPSELDGHSWIELDGNPYTYQEENIYQYKRSEFIL